MTRHLITVGILAVSAVSGNLALAQHGCRHSSLCHSSRSGTLGANYGYGYNPGISYEESVLRGMAIYNAATAQANLYNAQAASIRLANDLKAVQNRYAKGQAIAEGT